MIAWTLLQFALTIVVLLCIFNIFTRGHSELQLVAGPDGRSYRVRPLASQRESAAALARVNARLSMLIHRLQLSCEPEKREMVERMAQRYNPDVLSEGLVEDEKTSYTVNKGQEIVYCLRSRDGRDTLYPDNKLMHVAVHELAHIASVDTGHEKEFKTNLRYLERKSYELGLMQPITGSWEYCGITV